MNKSISFGLWILAFASFGFSVVLHRANVAIVNVHFLAPPPEHIEYFHFGFRESFADSLWIRWIQDSDSCQTYLTPEKILTDTVAYSDSLIANPRHRICDNSWSYKMLDAISRLAPRFKMTYLAGGPALAVLVEDYPGASLIFDRAIQNFPDDWPLLYRAAYHFLYDTQDLPKAADLLLRAADHGAPTWVKSLASRVYTRAGQIDLGIASLEAYRDSFKEQKSRDIVQKRIDELKAKKSKEP